MSAIAAQMYRTIIRATVEIILTAILLCFHGMWTIAPLLALIGCILWGSIENHAND